MIKSYLFILFTISLIFSSCKKELVNLSALKISDTENFVLRSIQEGENDEIICIGYRQDNNDCIILQYNKKLELIKSTNLTSLNSEFEGVLKVYYLKGKGWLISNVKKDSVISLTIFKTDKNFSVIAQNQNFMIPNHNNGKMAVGELKQLKNEDFIVSLSTYVHTSSFGVGREGTRFIRFDPQLKQIYSIDSFRDTRPYEMLLYQTAPRIIEMPDESIFYAFTAEAILKGFQFRMAVITGMIAKDGTPVYQNTLEVDKPSNVPIGLSSIGSQVLFNTKVNNEFLFYTLYDPATGLKTKRVTLPGTEKNYSSPYGDLGIVGNKTTNKYIFEANTLPETIEPGQGHLLYSDDTEELYFMAIDEQLNFSKKFTVLIPDFAELISYRQLFTEEGMLIGISYTYNGTTRFDLQKLTMNGELIK